MCAEETAFRAMLRIAMRPNLHTTFLLRLSTVESHCQPWELIGRFVKLWLSQGEVEGKKSARDSLLTKCQVSTALSSVDGTRELRNGPETGALTGSGRRAGGGGAATLRPK